MTPCPAMSAQRDDDEEFRISNTWMKYDQPETISQHLGQKHDQT